MKSYETLDLIDPPPSVVLGNHCIWLPSISIKVPFQCGGKITKRTRDEKCYPRETIVDEVCILQTLAKMQMAPPLSDLVFFREVISDYPGAWHSDPCGAYGFEMTNANGLPPGRFDINAMRQLPIEGSEGAWGDVEKSGNIINGYLIDARRSGHDVFRWHGPRFTLPDARESETELAARVHRECQFPAAKRDIAYQDFWLRGKLIRGQRRVEERARALSFNPSQDETVLDIGSQAGAFLQYAWNLTSGQGRYVGVDANDEYVRCAQALARSCNQNICFRRMDITHNLESFLSWIRGYFVDGIDHLLLLSMEKHISEDLLFRLIDMIKAKRVYVETNAVAKDDGSGSPPAAPMKLWEGVRQRGGRYVGDSRDRNLRRLYTIEHG